MHASSKPSACTGWGIFANSARSAAPAAAKRAAMIITSACVGSVPRWLRGTIGAVGGVQSRQPFSKSILRWGSGCAVRAEVTAHRPCHWSAVATVPGARCPTGRRWFNPRRAPSAAHPPAACLGGSSCAWPGHRPGPAIATSGDAGLSDVWTATRAAWVISSSLMQPSPAGSAPAPAAAPGSPTRQPAARGVPR